MNEILNTITGFADEFLGLILIFLTILILYLLSRIISNYIKSKSFFEYREGIQLDYRIKILFVLTGLVLIGCISILFFNFNVVLDYLRSLPIVNNNLLKITVHSFFVSLLTVYILYNLLIIFRNIIYIHTIRKFNEDTAGSFKSVFTNLGYLLLVLLFFVGLGVNWKIFVPIAGALGIGAGIGLQGILNNYFSGFILLTSRKLKIGDIVEIEGNSGRAIGNKLETIYGKIQTIDILNTVVLTVDGIEIVVPNSQFLSNQFVNYSLTDSKIRVRIPYGVSYSSDPMIVKEILLEVANKNTQILADPKPDVWFTEMGDSALMFNLLCWVDIKFLWKLSGLVSEINIKVWYKLKEEGITIPFPQNDVWFKNNLTVEIEKEVKKIDEE